MKSLLPFSICLLLAACMSKQVYVNKSGSCKLELYSDSSFYLKYPTFFESRHRTGTYKTTTNAILLRWTEENTYDSIEDCVTSYLIDHPDTVQFSFKNLNDSVAPVTFTINKNPKIFKTDNWGEVKLLYRDLLAGKIISDDSSFYYFNISFNNKTYIYADKEKYVLAKPTHFEFTLNQYIGKKEVVMYQRFDVKNDTVTVYGVDPKAIGGDRRLTRK